MLKAPDFFREEQDSLFIRGEQKGEQKAEKRIVRSLPDRGFTVEQVADIAGVTPDFVKRVQQSMLKN